MIVGSFPKMCPRAAGTPTKEDLSCTIPAQWIQHAGECVCSSQCSCQPADLHDVLSSMHSTDAESCCVPGSVRVDQCRTAGMARSGFQDVGENRHDMSRGKFIWSTVSPTVNKSKGEYRHGTSDAEPTARRFRGLEKGLSA